MIVLSKKCIRILRDSSNKQLYRLTVPKLKSVQNESLDKKAVKLKTECPNCNKKFEAKIGIKTHMRSCRANPSTNTPHS